ncbi:MAG: hypothetical protein V2A56_10195, partial [bacterium]
MSLVVSLLLAVAALVIGGLIGWLATRAAASSRIARLEAEAESAHREVEITEKERNQAREELSNAFKAISSDVLRSNS